MGTRGPQKGFKLSKLAEKEGAATPLSSIQTPIAAPATHLPKAKAPAVVLSAADLENPEKLTGEALHALAYRRGLSRSSLPDMSDEKIRLQLRMITNRQYEEEVA